MPTLDMSEASALTMSSENADLARLFCGAFNRRDLDAVLALTHADVEIEPRIGSLEGGFVGHEGVRRRWAQLLAAFPDYVAEIEEIQDFGDLTLGRLRGRAHGAASTTPVVEVWWQAITWRGGKCSRWRNFATESEALETVQREVR